MEKHVVMDMLDKKIKGCRAREERYFEKAQYAMAQAESKEAELYEDIVKLIKEGDNGN